MKNSTLKKRNLLSGLITIVSCYLITGLVYSLIYDSSQTHKIHNSLQHGYSSSIKNSIEMINVFKLNHEKIITLLTPKKFVYVIDNQAGLGNHLYSFISGVTVALYTNSALIVNWTGIQSFIEEPMRGSFQTSKLVKNELSYLYHIEECYQFPYCTDNNFVPVKNLSLNWRFETDHKTRVTIKSIGAVFFDFGCDTRFFQTFLDYGLVSNKTLNEALKVLEADQVQTNERNRNVTYRVGFELGHSILKLFWKPKRALLNQIALYHNKFFKKNFIIGIQLRFFYLKWRDLDVFADCAKRIETALNTTKIVKWFVSADSEEVLLAVKQRYPDKVVHANGFIGHTDAYSYEAYRRAIIDIELLALSDEIIITGGSTFGFIAALKKLAYPWTVEGSVNSTSCMRYSLSSPSITPNNYDII